MHMGDFCIILQNIISGNSEELSTLDVLLVLRVMRLVKIIASVKR